MTDILRLIEAIKQFMTATCLLAIAFLAILALPRCRLRELLLGLSKLVFVVLCLAYAMAPLDLMPHSIFGSVGLLDDAVATGLAIAAACSAIGNLKTPIRAGSARSPWIDEQFEL